MGMCIFFLPVPMTWKMYDQIICYVSACWPSCWCISMILCACMCVFWLLKWGKKLVWPLEKSSFQSVECEMEAFSFLPKGFNERIDYSALSTFRIVERESALLPFTFFSQTVSLLLQHICFYKKESAYMYEQNRKNRILCCSLCIAVASVALRQKLINIEKITFITCHVWTQCKWLRFNFSVWGLIQWYKRCNMLSYNVIGYY